MLEARSHACDRHGDHLRGVSRYPYLGGRLDDRQRTTAYAIDVLNRRLARGEIDRAEYDKKRNMIGR
jgi:hypothetical protein